MSIVRTTSPVFGSSRDTVSSRKFATQTPPAPIAIAVGKRPTWVVLVTTFVAGSIRLTAFSPLSATQTARAPKATALGPRPIGMVLTTTFVGAIRATSL